MMIYNIVKGADFMLFLPINSLSIGTILPAVIIVLLIIVGLAAFVIFSYVFRSRIKKALKKMKEKKNREIINPVTSIIGSTPERVAELNKELEPFGFAYDPYQDIFYSLMNPWQRSFGYCRLYDEATAPLSMIIDCEPIRFEYNQKKWLIEFWKGQYGMTTGGEVGIYYTNGSELNIPGFFNGTFYHCVKDEDRINMSFILRKNGNLLLTRSGYHWWLTGFKLGELSKPSELTMEIVLDLYDRQMVNAFVEALKKAGYGEDEYLVRGRRVYVNFTKPHTPQPLSRTTFTEFIAMRNNESLINAYNYLTEEYTDTLDKLVIVRNEAPNLYNYILNIGKPKAVYDAYNKIKGFLSDLSTKEKR